MVKRLKKIPKLREDKSETQVYADSDSIASLSESLKKIINASRPRKSIRKSIHGPLVPPKQLRIAPPKEKVDSHYQTLKKDIMYIRANDSDAARSKKFRRLSTRRSLSVPLMSSQKQRLVLKKSVSDTFITKSRPPFGKIIGEDLQDMGRPMDKSIPQAGDQLGLQIDENLNKTVAPRRDSIGYSTPTFPSKEKLRQLQEYNYEGLPEDFHRFFDNAHDTYNYERIVKSPEDEYGTEARDSRRQKDLKEYTPGRFLIKDLESDDKHKPLQTFLKDIIENNKFVEFGADVKGLMLVVGKHHMWNSLQLLHDDLMQSGFSRGEVKQMLSAKYMEYLSDIASGLQFAKIEAPRDIFLNFVETDPAKPKQMSQVDRLIAKNYWNKQRLSTRLIPFGMRGLKGTRSASPHSRRLSQDTRMDSAMYKKLMEQEMNAERLERENRKRRLFPTFSRIFGSFESAVSISSVNMAPDEEQDLRDSEMRYSLQNLNTVMNDHKLMFKAMDRKRLTAQLVQKKMEGQLKEMRSTTQFWRPKGKPTTFTLKKRKRGLRPIEALYYTPRKTSRMQKITEDSCSECECQEEKLADSMVLQKCPRCGVKVPVPAPTPPFYISPSSSSEILSSGSIEACAKNELVANTLADLCPRCGFVHGKNDPCSQLPQNRRKNSLLKRIQDSVRTAPQCTTFCSPGGILKKPRSFDP
uniref:Uncharacterized protein LOC108047689 n=1 Tax=Drosophila rhopaloa TaxID=1041015 RepID=A0A6P4F393_DRORH